MNFRQVHYIIRAAKNQVIFDFLRLNLNVVIFRETLLQNLSLEFQFVNLRLNLGGLVLFIPIGAAVVVIEEEELLGLAIHRLKVKDSTVGDKCLEAFLVVTSQVEYRVAAI